MPKQKGAVTKQTITIDDLIKRLIKIEKPSYWLHFSNRQAIDTYTKRFALDKKEVYERLKALKAIEEDTKKPTNMTQLVDYWKSVHAGKSPSIPNGFEGSFSQHAPSGSPPLRASSSSSSSSAVAPLSSSPAAVEASMGYPVAVKMARTLPPNSGGTRRKRRQNLTRRRRHRRR